MMVAMKCKRKSGAELDDLFAVLGVIREVMHCRNVILLIECSKMTHY